MASLDPIDELVRYLLVTGAPPPGWVDRWSRGRRDPLVEAWSRSAAPSVMLEILFRVEHPQAALARRWLTFEEGTSDVPARRANAVRAAAPEPPTLAEVRARFPSPNRKSKRPPTQAELRAAWPHLGRPQPIAPLATDLDRPEHASLAGRLFRPVNSLGLPPRVVEVLEAAGHLSPSHLQDLAAFELARVGLTDAEVVLVRAALGSIGLHLRGEAPPPPRGVLPEHDWGSLYVRGSLAAVTAAVTEVFAAAGMERVASKRAPSQTKRLAIGKGKLVEDELVVQEEAGGWVALASHHLEWSPPGRHPLALALSRTLEVLSITSVARRYCEVCLYRGGALAEASFAGPKPPDVSELDAPSLALERLFDDDAAIADARELLDDPEALLKLLGPDTHGHRGVFEVMTLEDLGDASYFVFRKANARRAKAVKTARTTRRRVTTSWGGLTRR